MSDPQRLIIDTDPGVDDAQAIMLAHAHPAVRIEALTVVAGNVGLQHTIRNACKLADVLGADFAIYPGCDSALAWQGDDAAFVHGRDGFGDIGFPDPARRPSEEHASAAMVRMINAEPDAFTLVSIGPMTNIAVALKLDPGLPAKVKRLVVMGGAVTGHGNVSNLTAEFNVYSDPEAAHIVFSAFPAFELVDWEATMAHEYSFEQLDAWLESGSPQARFYGEISQAVRAFVRRVDGRSAMRAADALAMAVVVEPDIVEAAEHRHVAVELHGSATRGQTVVDWQGRGGRPANARIVRRVDYQRFLALNEAAFA